MIRQYNRLISAALGVAITAGALTATSLIASPPAHAIVCGYSEEIETYNTPFRANLPIVGSIDPFGGQRQVAHYGNCGSTKVRIKVGWKGGSGTYCVKPGDTRLGFTENDKQISSAKKIGTC